jgi:HPt (histidine-containing phosphotransfer) domain-containing protein
LALKLLLWLADDLFMANGGTREAVSLARLTALLEGDAEGGREVLGLFLEELPRFGEALQQAKSPKELARALHRFRGSLLSLGLRSTADYLGELETKANAATVLDASVAESICALIPELVTQTKRELA